jgi:two-component system phosphate regulon sensor histidine kinase PhoR
MASTVGLALAAALVGVGVLGVVPAAEEDRVARTSILATAAALLVVCVAVMAFVRTITRGIQDATSFARAMAEGDLRPDAVHLRLRDELGTLGATMAKLADGMAGSLAALGSERDLYIGILEGMSEGVLVTDIDGLVRLANRSIRDMLGMKGSPVGRQPIEVSHLPALAEALDQATRSNGVVSREAEVSVPARRTLVIHAAPLPIPELGGAVGVVHDITELRRLERVRRDFVANVSHELRTPIASVLGAAETLDRGALEDTAAARRFVDSVHRNAVRLAAIVEDLLRLSRIESGEWPYDLQDLRVHEVARRTLDEAAQAAAQKHIRLVNDADPAATVRADEPALELVLRNLVDNAVKYSPGGTLVRISARSLDGITSIEVHDQGVGIDTAALPRIFERFYRVDKGRSREAGGTGLGLSIVKNLVQGMNGEVSVQSEPGRGSTFIVTLESPRR